MSPSLSRKTLIPKKKKKFALISSSVWMSPFDPVGIFAAEKNGILLPANLSTPSLSAATTAKQRWQSAAHSARFIKINEAIARSKARLLTARFTRTTESFTDVVSCYQVPCIISRYTR